MPLLSLGLSTTKVSGGVAAAMVAASVALVAVGMFSYVRATEPFKTWFVVYASASQFGGIFMYSNAVWGVLWVGLFLALRNRKDAGTARTWLAFFLAALAAGTGFALASLDWSQLPTVMQLGSKESLADSAGHAPEVAVTILEGSSVVGNPSYGPGTVTARADELITWVNADTAPHTVTGGYGAGDPEAGRLFDSGSIGQGKKFSLPAKNLGAGEYDYYCVVHPFMKGRIVVQ